MRRAPLLTAAMLLALGCVRPAPPPASVPEGRAALRIEVEPNPIVATHVDGSTWEFPFSLAIREVGGAPIVIDRVGVDVLTVGGLRVYSTELGAAELDERGHPRRLPALGVVRYAMSPRQHVPDERLFGSVWAELWVVGTDAEGRRTTTRTRATVERG
ncbi:MAG TPA: hypothetical protein VMS56_09605 [Thermoanaerobaculia bacterium]|nr:hypothetical protein [Thermoanaerobaculia bacterium]